MSREWQPGDVAMVTAEWKRGVPQSEPAVRDSDGWQSLLTGAYRDHCEAKDARPLVLIDPEDDEAVERLDALLHRMIVQRSGSTHTIGDLAAALREFADPKPPKPDEPTGLGAVVRDANNELWIRTCHPCDDCLNKPWQRGPVHKNWQIIDAIEVLTDGYDQGSGEPLADWERDLLRGQS